MSLSLFTRSSLVANLQVSLSISTLFSTPYYSFSQPCYSTHSTNHFFNKFTSIQSSPFQKRSETHTLIRFPSTPNRNMSQIETYPRLQDKIVFITGASSGIGEACARVFAASGSKLVLGARRREKLESLKKEFNEKYKTEVHVFELDVREIDSVTNFFNNIPEGLKNIDILVNNAGLAIGKDKTWETSEESLNAMIDTNVKGVHRLIRLIVPGMRERNRGHVINISSIAGKESYVGGSIYCASKFAVEAINIALRKELVDTQVRVTSIGPGSVETEFSVVRFGGDKQKADQVYVGYKPLVAQDIADNVAYVASRPEHVQIADLVVFPSNQASSEIVYKKQ